MKLTYRDKRLYMDVDYTERMTNIPLLYGAKVQLTTGLWEASISSLLPAIVIFDDISPTDKDTEKILNTGKLLLANINRIKNKVKTKQKVTNKDMPFLMSHQAACVAIADIRPRYGLFLDTGTR